MYVKQPHNFDLSQEITRRTHFVPSEIDFETFKTCSNVYLCSHLLYRGHLIIEKDDR